MALPWGRSFSDDELDDNVFQPSLESKEDGGEGPGLPLPASDTHFLTLKPVYAAAKDSGPSLSPIPTSATTSSITDILHRSHNRRYSSGAGSPNTLAPLHRPAHAPSTLNPASLRNPLEESIHRLKPLEFKPDAPAVQDFTASLTRR